MNTYSRKAIKNARRIVTRYLDACDTTRRHATPRELDAIHLLLILTLK